MKRIISLILVLILAFSSLMIADAASYTPAKVTGVKAVYVSTASVKLKWNEAKKVTGYKIYKYIDSQQKYVALKKTNSNVATVAGLKEGTAYKLAVRAFRKFDGKTYYGNYSDKIKLTTAKVKKSDIESLGGLLSFMNIVKYDGNIIKYNYKTTSYRKTLDLIGAAPFYGGMILALSNLGWDAKFIDFYDSTGKDIRFKKSDPRGTIAQKKWEDGQYKYNGYYKVSEKRFDWVIKNIYNKKPSHDNSVIKSTSFWEDVYYYKGYYYLAAFDGIEYYWPSVFVLSKSENPQGLYNLKIRAYESDLGDDNYYPISSEATVTARLKKIDGKRIWSIYKIK